MEKKEGKKHFFVRLERYPPLSEKRKRPHRREVRLG